MKLELKHLAPYLPYGLKYQWCSWGDKNISEINTLGILDHLVGCPIGVNNIMTLDRCKPILRPLSDFMEIQDGAMFFSPYTLSTVDMDGGLEANINSIPYSDFIWLVSESFDVFGLIPAGLAVDINTLSDEK